MRRPRWARPRPASAHTLARRTLRGRHDWDGPARPEQRKRMRTIQQGVVVLWASFAILNLYVWWRYPASEFADAYGFTPLTFLQRIALALIVCMGLSAAVLWQLRERRPQPVSLLSLSRINLASGVAQLWMVSWIEGSFPLNLQNANRTSLTLTFLVLIPLLLPARRRDAWLSIGLGLAAVPLTRMGWAWASGWRLSPFGLSQQIAAISGGALLVVASYMEISGLARRLEAATAEVRELGSYRLNECLGRGGMGEVWTASHRLLARPAAVKLIRPDRLGKDGQLRGLVGRFEREARATAALRSPHTVEVYDFGVMDDGQLYYVMELLDGIDLQTLVKRHGPLPPSRVVPILRQICLSLREAHEQGLVHRDIKPANIMLCRRYGGVSDFVKVLDFGLVKTIERDLPNSPAAEIGRALETELTGYGAVLGTASYIAPEVILGDTPGPGADLYALGGVAWWLLTGRRIYPGRDRVTIMRTQLDRAPDLREGPEDPVGQALVQLVAALTERMKERRPAGAQQVLDTLARVPEHEAWSQQEAEAWWLQRSRPSPVPTDSSATTAILASSTEAL